MQDRLSLQLCRDPSKWRVKREVQVTYGEVAVGMSVSNDGANAKRAATRCAATVA